MRVSIYTHTPDGWEAVALQDAARAAGATVQAGAFATEAERQALYTSDVLIMRIAPRYLDEAIQLAKDCALYAPQMLLHVSAEGIQLAGDKYLTYQQLSEHNIPTPQTYLLQQLDDCDVHGLKAMLPMIIKPRRENRGIGVSLATTDEELRDIVESLLATYGSCIAQPYIVEAGNSDIRAFVVGDTVAAAMRRTAPAGSHTANLHQGGIAEPVRLSDADCQLAVAAAQLCGAEFAGIDLLESANGKVVLEINVSPGLKIGQITNTNVAEAVINHMLQKRKRGRS